MSISEADLCSYGHQLAGCASELEWRNSIGRSYYAAYHRANSWHEALSTKGSAPAGMGVHATLISCLVKPNVTGAKKMTSMSVGYLLQSMKSARQKADYDLGCGVDANEAATVAAQASTLLAKAV